ncbi:MAG TPA: DUF2059 domain-containing protein [Acidobacteriaceae bacterium]|jgi:hypothetical protein|nr:DUF2059 domain-containing protein [Acidobacteriaceae bacterium]
MKRWIVIMTVVCVCGCSFARADEVSRRAKAEELFVTMHMDQTMGQLMNAVMTQVQQMTQSVPGADRFTPEQRKEVADFQQRVADVTEKKLGWKAMEPDFITLYASTYTEEELDGILAFYKSPVGQSMLEKTPELMQKGMEIAQQRVKEIQPELNQMTEDFIEQMAAEAAKPATGSTAAPASSGPKK